MNKLIVISALAIVLTFGSGSFVVLSGQESGERGNALPSNIAPTKSARSYVPWTGLKKSLERAKSVRPENYAVPYYLGHAYLREGDRNAAIAEWEHYLAMAPKDFKSVSVREQLTVLMLDQAAQYAKQIVGQGGPAEDIESRLNENTLAVLNFKNLATPDFTPFIKALAMVLITDLSRVSELLLVERLKVQAVVAEMKLGATGIADSATAATAGKFLLAKNVIWGTVGSPRKDMVRITAIVGETIRPSDPVVVKSEGARDQFFELEKQLVFGILAALGLNKEDIAPSVLRALEKYHTTNYNAFISFGEGLDHLDRKDFAGAKAAFRHALDVDPNFDVSRKLEKATPRSAITLTAVDLYEVNDTFEEVTQEAEQTMLGLVDQMSATMVSQSFGVTKEISDIAQDKLEILMPTGNIIVHW